MSRIQKSAIAIILGLIFAGFPLSARAQSTPTEMKLLTQNTGWLLNGMLYWTNDFGQDWRNITPPRNPPGATQIASVFFLDESNGWALLVTSHPPITNGVVFGDWGFELAYTDNGGASWTEKPVRLPGFPKGQDLGGGGTIDFVDPSHGWMDLSLESSVGVSRGVLFSTSDGGETWRLVMGAPTIAASVKFVTLKDGWMAGGGGGEDLYSTRDGGETWARIVVKAPPQAGSGMYVLGYRLPVFKGPKQALLPLTLWAAESQSPTLVLYRSSDGGRTWRATRVLPNRPEGAHYDTGANLPTAVVDATLILPQAGRGRITLRTISPSGESTVVGSAPVAWNQVASGIDFPAIKRGWVLAGGLYATTDGGATWKDITPRLPMRYLNGSAKPR